MKLTENQKRFADEYLIDFNATRAYKSAYPSCKKDETAAAAGARLLKNVKVSEYIARQQLELRNKAEISKTELLEQLEEIALAKIDLSNIKVLEKLKAIDQLAKMLGYDLPKVTDSDEVLAKAKELLSGVESGF